MTSFFDQVYRYPSQQLLTTYCKFVVFFLCVCVHAERCQSRRSNFKSRRAKFLIEFSALQKNVIHIAIAGEIQAM